jgi:hypothetical protein
MRAALALLLLAGCGSSPANGDMMAALTCADESMDVPSYLGDSAGAYQAALAPIAAWVPDLQLAFLRGSNLPLDGKTATGMQGGEWVVNFYSPTTQRLYVGAFGATVAHVSCQNVNVSPVPPAQAAPHASSSDVLATAIARIQADTPNPMLFDAQSVTYGVVSAGSNPPHSMAWGLSLPPWTVIVDDASGAAVECLRSGAPCN